MIAKETYTIDYVNTLREKYKKDPSLLESQYKKLSYMRSQSPEAFAYIVEALRMIEG